MMNMHSTKNFVFSKNPEVARLQRYALEFQPEAYHRLAETLVRELDGEELGEVLLLQAQVKLFTADNSLLDDLSRAARLLPEGSRLGQFLEAFLPLDPNGFILFAPKAGAVAQFWDTLQKAGDLLEQYCGPMGLAISRQMQSEILYFTGKIRDGTALSQYLFHDFSREEAFTQATMAGYTLIRCALAGGDPDLAENTLIQIVGWVRRATDAPWGQMYGTIRSWLNLTTGWSGDSPRYHITPGSIVYPALEDRTEAIHKGIAELGPTEAPFAQLARLAHPEAYTVRQLYMDIFHAMVQFKYSIQQRVPDMLYPVYTICRENDIVMPFVEYGTQIVPMLEFVTRFDPQNRYSNDWTRGLIARAKEYESFLDMFRDI